MTTYCQANVLEYFHHFDQFYRLLKDKDECQVRLLEKGDQDRWGFNEKTYHKYRSICIACMNEVRRIVV